MQLRDPRGKQSLRVSQFRERERLRQDEESADVRGSPARAAQGA